MRKNILITGASSGLGKGMAKEFAKQGCNLALCARRFELLEQLKSELEQINPNITISIKVLDVNDHEQVFSVFNAFKDELNGLDRVIINAGMGKGASIGTGYFNANKQTAQTNFVAALAQAEAAMEIFRAQNHGHLVTISSISAVRGFRRAMTVYAATKAAITSLSEGIRIDVMHTPIKVSCVHPGFIRSEINEKVKTVPFIVDTETGCKALIKAINKEKANSFVPSWPWAFLHWVLRIAPLSTIRKMS
ncbi:MULTISPECIES: SDR family oxidoreductase [unclassified Pseudoalteromonas]|uniref:SDR family oxidoreductase n=1 Tax=unclassified Pseudoalteromonas TaxID=194690 RepID=UPI0023592A4E|nr:MULTISPECIES: SDR family oxidoreductase [unclassified Pseudoalteromonas]MDC9566609.1 SDR family oxidoreductase [Pseudoalteromonas sp. GAB2316C]MDC9570457.1 SDR family oxidoreductase [Pseudoalteromonas sp. GABNB9D]MDC9574568.1 SDR family oxidoreductase [Pseudoalteromonas sp. GABNS16A]MDC9578982.1 SDR family oxidoreductase [Pseudoalteromonas sp. GABNS16E]MDC9586604.1 SDR family oxidoreductase [Pseudoalteromonas sp. GABNS16C]